MSESMRWISRSIDRQRLSVVLFLGTLIIGLAIAPYVAGADQSAELGISLDVPSEAETGEEVTISETVSVPDIPGSYESKLTVTLLIDGSEVATRTVTVEDGETITESFTHTFSEAGSHTVTVEGSITIGGQSFSNSQSTTIEVTEPPTPTPTPTPTQTPTQTQTPTSTPTSTPTLPSTPTSTPTPVSTPTAPSTPISVSTPTVTPTVPSTRTVSTPTQPGTRTLSGVAFTVPDSLTDEVEDYRSDVPTDLAPNAFILATQGNLYVVFTQASPTKGRATVEGVVIDQQFSVTRDETTLTFGGVAAANASFETTGTETTVKEVAANPDEYRLELVRFTTSHRRVTTLTDPDEGGDFTASTTIGTLTPNPVTARSLFSRLGSHARTISRNASESEVKSILENPGSSSDSRLYTFSFETDFWTSAEATVDGIVLNPQSEAARFARTIDQSQLVDSQDGSPVVYVVEQQLNSESMSSVGDITGQADSLDGEVVSVTARMYGADVSVQETVEHATTSQCSEDRLQIQTPQGPACVNVVQDELIRSGVLWSTVPTERSEVLSVIGVSSEHQDEPTQNRTGRFRVVGEVVSTSRINESLPNGSVLLAYEMERTGDIDYREVSGEARQLINSQTGMLQKWVRGQVGTASVPNDDQTNLDTDTGVTVQQQVSSVTAGKQAEVALSTQAQQQTGVGDVSITTTQDVSDVSVSVTAVESLPTSVQAPPEQAVRTLNISVDAQANAIANGTFTVDVPASDFSGPANTTVHRYQQDSWQQLEYTVVDRSESVITLEVSTPGYSYFAVTTSAADGATTTETSAITESSPQQTTDGTTSSSGPGFAPLAALIAIALFTSYRLMKKS